MDDSTPPPVQRWRYGTTNVDEGTEALRAQYTDHTPRFSRGHERFEFRLESDAVDTDLGRLGIDRTRHTMRTSVVAEPAPRQLVIVPFSGWARFSCGRSEASSVILVPTAHRFEVEWDALSEIVGHLDVDGLRRVGAELAGIDPEVVEFTSMNPLSPALGRYVTATLDHLRRDVLTNDQAMAFPLARAQAFRQLATALLMAFPNTTQTLDADDGATRAEPATVRRAVDFIDTNADRPIGVTEIAEAARLGVRGLQVAFRRHRETTPMAYLKRVRMERAHRDLQAGDPRRGDTVAAVAARWGFTNPGSFAVQYRHLHGRSPSDTLRG
jgi:AraC-like DNA-binding protein